MKLDEWLDIWIKDYCRDIKPKTLVCYEANIKNNIKPALGSVRLQAIPTHEIQALYNRLPLAPKTIKNIHGVLHKALQQAVEIGYIKYNPSGACKLPRVVKAEIKPLEEDEIACFLDAIKGHEYENAFPR
jgi:integrase